MVEQSRSLFRVGVNDEYVHVIDDVIRLIMIQVVVQMMFYINSPKDFPFFTPERCLSELEGLDLPADVMNAVLHDNAARILS